MRSKKKGDLKDLSQHTKLIEQILEDTSLPSPVKEESPHAEVTRTIESNRLDTLDSKKEKEHPGQVLAMKLELQSKTQTITK